MAGAVTTPLVRARRADLRVLLCGLWLGAFVAAGCGATLDVSVDGSRPTPSPTSLATEEPSTVPEVIPTGTPTPAPTSTPRPPLPYDDAVAAYFADVEAFWTRTAPDALGEEFTPVAALIPFDPTDEDALPSCDGEVGPREIYEDNAFYCLPDDTIAWDDVGLFPDLYDTFGDFAVGLVIAHEYAHAVQNRADLDGPTIYVELQADCLAGAWAQSVGNDGESPLAIDGDDLDSAVGGMVTFADPPGTLARDAGAHGSAFDRLNAFGEGYEGGVLPCLSYLDDPPDIPDLGPADPDGGNMALNLLLPLVYSEWNAYLPTVVSASVSAGYAAPGEPIEIGQGAAPTAACDGVEIAADTIDGSAFFCEEANTVYIDRAELDQLWREGGDFVSVYAVAHAYATSVAVDYVDAGDSTAVVLAADCLVGSWARDVFDNPFGAERSLALSPGDLDEGIVGLAVVPATGPSLAAVGPVRSFDRVRAYGDGFFDGGDCGR